MVVDGVVVDVVEVVGVVVVVVEVVVLVVDVVVVAVKNIDCNIKIPFVNNTYFIYES